MDMKARLAALTMTALMGAAAVPMAHAQYVGPSSQKTFTNVEQVTKNAKDDDPVSLRGKLVRKLSDETYLFADETGEIQVEIDDKIFPKEPVDANTTVEIVGEMDKALVGTSEVDVKAITIIR
ncbi:YgiW/YdeI family stress tolerance OB fold protein [Alcaligenes parafaecalis]|uniref:NirD/YgiW/YdeI family stress tolerance protein n=1 Tax=Alcaligenes parafaecalis TaxID=171260 RepID=A0ABT3VKJ4_9BURK|nr:NirD/YgiW/YdeI family stress tolerance protein [Alcaligenes parafaecalis]MCX5462760.1 NirD/YgiW/YdeI family stress tolerance protein [Alcaligenes parafaecalis]